MSRFHVIWERAERICIYLILIIFILLEFLAIFIPLISCFMDSKGTILMLAFVSLAIFRYIDKNIASSNRNEITQINKFTVDLISILNKPKYNEVKIFANSSFKYFQAINESQIEIENVIVMVRNHNNSCNIQFPSDENSQKDFVHNLNQLIEDWKTLQKNGRIKNLEIRFYSFDSILHFMIIDNEILHFGLLKPIKKFPGSELNGSVVVNSNSKNGRELISSFSVEFDAIYNDFSSD